MRKLLISVFFVCLLSVLTVAPLFKNGFFEFHDNTQVVRVYEMGKMLSAHSFPVRWVPDLGYGYGYPIFNFYGPLPYYIGGILNIIGFDSLVATKLMLFIGMFIAPLTMFFLARKFFGDIAGIVCSVVYAYFPYHAVNMYVRGAVGELYAYAFLPLVFLGFFSLLDVKKNSNIYWPFLSVALGIFLVATSHNLTFFILLMMLMPLAIIGYFFAASRKIYIVFTLLGIFFGVALASFYIIPAFFEMAITNVSSQVGGGADFKDHFVCISQYWNSVWGYGGSVPGCLDGISFKLGKINILLLVLAFVAYFATFRKRISNKIVLSFVGLFIATFMTLLISKYVWETIPFIEYIQYPWRFINFIALFTTVIIGYLIFVIKRQINEKAAYIFAGIMLIATIFTNAKLFVPQSYIDRSAESYNDQRYIKFTASKISDEYLPPGFQKPRQEKDVPTVEAQILKTNGALEFLAIKPNHYLINYAIKSDGVVHINKAYYPFWEAKLNERIVPIVPTSNGMNVSIPAGKGSLEVRMKSTALQITGNVLTILSILALTAVIMYPTYRTKLLRYWLKKQSDI